MFWTYFYCFDIQDLPTNQIKYLFIYFYITAAEHMGANI